MDSKTLHNRIMRRVYVMFVLRKAIQPYAIRAYALSISLAGILSLVSVGNVIANMPALSDVSGLLTFLVSALAQTESMVQILVFGSVAVALWLVRDLVTEGAAHTVHRFSRV